MELLDIIGMFIADVFDELRYMLKLFQVQLSDL